MDQNTHIGEIAFANALISSPLARYPEGFDLTETRVRPRNRDPRTRDAGDSVSVVPANTQPGGELRFLNLDDGRVVVDRWRLWVPENWRREVATRYSAVTTIRLRGGDILMR